MRTLKLRLAYDGTPFVGWQRQASGVSIQGLVEAAIERIEGSRVTVTAAGRTDAGVHALGQVASVTLAHPIPASTLARALNAMLPPEIRALTVEDAPDGFNARFAASRKTYRYRVLNAPTADPFEQRYAWHVPEPLDRRAMEEALRQLRGRHDFASFRAAGGAATTTVRTLFDARLVEQRRSFLAPLESAEVPYGTEVIVIEMTADGFLRQMVRNIVGTLVEVGLGRRDGEDVRRLIGLRDRRSAGPTAPPHGLFLVGVEYVDEAGRVSE